MSEEICRGDNIKSLKDEDFLTLFQVGFVCILFIHSRDLLLGYDPSDFLFLVLCLSLKCILPFMGALSAGSYQDQKLW